MEIFVFYDFFFFFANRVRIRFDCEFNFFVVDVVGSDDVFVYCLLWFECDLCGDVRVIVNVIKFCVWLFVNDKYYGL